MKPVSVATYVPSSHFKELNALYPGRLGAIFRLTAACTLSLVVLVQFRVPGAVLGTIIPFLLPRDGVERTLKGALLMGAVAVLATAYVIVGAELFAGVPVLHFFWVCASLFLLFWMLHTFRSYETMLGLGLLLANAISVWDQPVATHAQIVTTLFTLVSVFVACTCTVLTELVALGPSSARTVEANITTRLRLAADYLLAIENHAGNQHDLHLAVVRLAQRGTAADQELLLSGPARIGELQLVLAGGRLLDQLATWVPGESLDEIERKALRALSHALTMVAADGSGPPEFRMPSALDHRPILVQIAITVSAVVQICGSPNQDPALKPARNPLFAPDFLRNPAHLRFALRGSLSAILCYCFYMSVGWRGLNAALTTCILTAVPTIRATRHRQVLRFGGMFLGAAVLGVGAESLLLSQVDSLLPFALVFAVVTVIAAWLSTSTAKYAFAGLQCALAFDIVVLARFSVSANLIATRDCIFGIVLGIAGMWLVFEILWPKDTRHALAFMPKKTFESYLKPLPSGTHLEEIYVAAARRAEEVFRAADRVELLNDMSVFEFGSNELLFFAIVSKQFAVALRQAAAHEPLMLPQSSIELLDSFKGHCEAISTFRSSIHGFDGSARTEQWSSARITDTHAHVEELAKQNPTNGEFTVAAVWITYMRRLANLIDRSESVS